MPFHMVIGGFSGLTFPYAYAEERRNTVGIPELHKQGFA